MLVSPHAVWRSGVGEQLVQRSLLYQPDITRRLSLHLLWS